jgi:hypothetical protein
MWICQHDFMASVIILMKNAYLEGIGNVVFCILCINVEHFCFLFYIRGLIEEAKDMKYSVVLPVDSRYC